MSHFTFWYAASLSNLAVRSFRIQPSRQDKQPSGSSAGGHVKSSAHSPTHRRIEAAQAHRTPTLQLQDQSDASEELIRWAALGLKRLMAALSGSKGIRTPRWIMMIFTLLFSLQVSLSEGNFVPRRSVWFPPAHPPASRYFTSGSGVPAVGGCPFPLA